MQRKPARLLAFGSYPIRCKVEYRNSAMSCNRVCFAARYYFGSATLNRIPHRNGSTLTFRRFLGKLSRPCCAVSESKRPRKFRAYPDNAATRFSLLPAENISDGRHRSGLVRSEGPTMPPDPQPKNGKVLALCVSCGRTSESEAALIRSREGPRPCWDNDSVWTESQ